MGARSFNLQHLVDTAIDRLKDQGEVDPVAASQIRMNVLEVLSDELKARGAGRFAIKRAGHIIEAYPKRYRYLIVMVPPWSFKRCIKRILMESFSLGKSLTALMDRLFM